MRRCMSSKASLVVTSALIELATLPPMLLFSHEFDGTLPVTGGYHELLHGPEWQEAADHMVQWMAQHSAGEMRSKL